MTTRLTFSAKAHTYALDGKRIPGVTTVIRNATDKPALVGAAARETAQWAVGNVEAVAALGEAEWIAAAKAHYREKWAASGKRGTLLHEAARQLVRGDAITPAEDWTEDVIATAGQLARFMDRWHMDPEWTETPLYHAEDRWAGTTDAIARLRDGARWLLDYKTGESGVYPEHALQVCAYRFATHMQLVTNGEPTDWPMVEVDRCGLVWVQPDFYELRPVVADEDRYRVFRSMLTVSDWTGWDVAASIGDPLPIPAVAS